MTGQRGKARFAQETADTLDRLVRREPRRERRAKWTPAKARAPMPATRGVSDAASQLDAEPTTAP